jgi:hypothetical protein
MGFKSVYFDDDTFNCGKTRMLEFCSQIRMRKLEKIPWAIMARPDLMDEEILRNMKDAGLYAIKYGVESATQGLLDNINKGMDLKKTEEMIRLTESLGIKTHLTFTFGLPGETKESIRKTIDFAVNLDPNSVQFSITTPFPGTEFYNEMKKKGYILSHEWSEYDGNYKSVICSEHLSKKDLESAIRCAYREWVAHSIRRRLLKGQRLGLSPSRAFLYYLKHYGPVSTLLRSTRFAVRLWQGAFLETLGRLHDYARPKPVSQNTVSAGRLMLVFESLGVRLFWDGKELTRGKGFTSFASVDLDGRHMDLPYEFVDFKKLADTTVQMKKKYAAGIPAQEWGFEIVDEKQIDWHVRTQEPADAGAGHGNAVGLILSGEYRHWVDSWGEGGFYPSFDHMEVELRNFKTKVIGVRGRKKIIGEIPTILLDASGNNGVIVHARNSACIKGARALEIRQPAGLFSGRIKIVEEDFKKRKNAL